MVMKKKDLTRFAERLREEKTRLLNHGRLKQDDIAVSTDDLADEVDQASSELVQGVTLRLRDRERTLLMKIEEALAKIDNGTFGICESCEEPIELKRLEARPMASLCVSCKEQEERSEKVYA